MDFHQCNGNSMEVDYKPRNNHDVYAGLEGVAPAFRDTRSHVDEQKSFLAESVNLQLCLCADSSADQRLPSFESTFPLLRQIGELPRQPDPTWLPEYIVRNNVPVLVLDSFNFIDVHVDDTPMEVSSIPTTVQNSEVVCGQHYNIIEARSFANEQDLVNFLRNFENSEDSAPINQEQSQEGILELKESTLHKTPVACNSVSDGSELNQNSEEKMHESESQTSSHFSEPSPSCSPSSSSNRKSRGKPKAWTLELLEDKKKQCKREWEEAKDDLSSTPEHVAELAKLKLRYKHASNHHATFKRDQKNKIRKAESEAEIQEETSRGTVLINEFEQNREKLLQLGALLEKYK